MEEALKRRHKVTAGIGIPAAVGLLTFALQAWNGYQTALRNRLEWERAVAACEAAHRIFWRGDCKPLGPGDERERK